ncbi:SURF1 family protein [Kineosporia sp. J2-2]|uniref:SURF1-like protein n=1 Tax=Kineosporia corallincola TaxID=2835133 RepID=A0ABS5TQG0_9ACTN|nr:SURF1 family protein [Kineosporia corallincola]MBT0772406.1 SURF1 family protein [Kineosporia corallincola]
MSVEAGPSVDDEQERPHRGALGTTWAALGLLRERRWAGALAGVVVLTIVFLFLGRWQLHRHEAKSARNHLIAANYDATPVPLAQILPAGATLADEQEWRQVTVTGEYLADDTVLIRNRPHDQIGQAGTVGTGGNSQNGYEVVVPLRGADGTVLFVDRGWIPAGSSDASRPDSVPAPPTGQVTVVARLRPSEPASDRTAPAGQAARLNVAALTGQTGLDAADVVGAFGALVSEDPPAADTPEAAEEPDTGLGINLSYSVQWDSFAIIAYVLFGVAMVREVRRRDEEDEDEDDGSAGAEPVITRATYR